MIDSKKIFDINVNNLAEEPIFCDCGRKHFLQTKMVCVEEDATKKMKLFADKLQPIGRAIVVYEKSDLDRFALEVMNLIKSDYREISILELEDEIRPTEKDFKKLENLEYDIRLVISVGGELAESFAKKIADMRNISYIAVVTKPTLTVLSKKMTFYKNGISCSKDMRAPDVVVFDTNAIKKFRNSELSDGFMLVVSKLISLFDKNVESRLTGVNRCVNLENFVIQIISEMVDISSNLISGQVTRFYDYAKNIMQMNFALTYFENDYSPLLGAECAVKDTLLSILSKKKEKKFTSGEIDIFIFNKLIRIYRIFFANKVEDNALFPDMDARSEMLKKYLGLSELQAMKLTSNSISPKSYELLRKGIEDYRDYFSSSIFDLYLFMPKIENIYNTISGYKNKSNSISNKDIKNAIVLSTELTSKFNTLKVMKYFGLLEGYVE